MGNGESKSKYICCPTRSSTNMCIDRDLCACTIHMYQTYASKHAEYVVVLPTWIFMPHVCKGQKRAADSLDQFYKLLLAAMQVLGIKPKSSEASVLECQAISPMRVCYCKETFLLPSLQTNQHSARMAHGISSKSIRQALYLPHSSIPRLMSKGKFYPRRGLIPLGSRSGLLN